MKILIVENEIYLAQSISTRLSELGYNCDIAGSIREALREDNYDAILLSTNISGQNFYPVIEKHKAAIIILMISYISNDTVSDPIKAGANDYIQKPFMIEELIRKLQHLRAFDALKRENRAYRSYMENLFEDSDLKAIDTKIKLPLLLKANFQKHADALVFKYAFEINKPFTFISLGCANAIDKISRASANELLYIIDLQNLKNNEKNKIINLIEDRAAIISTTNMDEKIEHIHTLAINSDESSLEHQDVLSIDDYVKYVITNFQDNFPDTELSKKLGISRKSLWEKRKKYGIQKQK